MANPFIGQITLFPYNFAPVGWAFCAGQLLPISQNTALFSLLGTQFGGDGKSNFALPDLLGAIGSVLAFCLSVAGVMRFLNASHRHA